MVNLRMVLALNLQFNAFYQVLGVFDHRTDDLKTAAQTPISL